MKIHFIYPDMGTKVYKGVHHGVASISAVLKANGHEVSLHHVVKHTAESDLIRRIRQEDPGLICFSATTNQYPFVKLYSKWIEQAVQVPILVGGIHATLCPEDAMASDDIDMICRGEGEYPLLELADCLEKGKPVDMIDNLWIRKGQDIIRNSVRPLISDLDSLPYPDYEVFGLQEILKASYGKLRLMAGRGCPFSCTYCCNTPIREIYKGKGKYVRWRTVDNLLDQIESIVQKYDVKRLDFEDDTFTLSKRWLEEFCEKYPKRFHLPFTCNTRPDVVNRQLLFNLRKAGCHSVSYGIEAGDEWLRKTVLKRDISDKQIIEAFRDSHEIGLGTSSFNMIGLPFETPDMIERTIELNRQVSAGSVAVFYFYPYPTTELWRLCVERGYLAEGKTLPSYEEGSILNLPGLSGKQLSEYYHKFIIFQLSQRIQARFPALVIPFKIINALLGKKTEKFIDMLAFLKKKAGLS